MPKIGAEFRFFPTTETLPGASIPLPPSETDEWEPTDYGHIRDAQKVVLEHATRLHRNNGGCPVFAELREVATWTEGDMTMEGERVCRYRIRPSAEWTAAMDAASEQHAATLTDPERQRANAWRRLDEGEPVSCCLSCGKEGVNALRGLCGSCWLTVPTPLRTAVDMSAKFTRQGRTYDRAHRVAIGSAATAALRHRGVEGPLPYYGEGGTVCS